MKIERPEEPPNELEEREIRTILERFKSPEGSLAPVYELMDRQLSVIHERAQSLIQLAGVVITVTGFSGRIIADTNNYAQILIILGVGLVGLGAGVTMARVLPIRWLSSYMDQPDEDWLLIALRRRQKKSRAFGRAQILVVVGMIFYIAAISVMLAYPEATELDMVR